MAPARARQATWRSTKTAHEALYITFRDELTRSAQKLTQLVMRDGEGATKFVTVSMTEASSNANTLTPQLPMRTKPATTLVPCKRRGLGRRRKVKRRLWVPQPFVGRREERGLKFRQLQPDSTFSSESQDFCRSACRLVHFSVMSGFVSAM